MGGSARRARGYVVANAFSAPPTISGTAQVGQTLTGANGTPVGATYASRQWTRDAVPIAGATAATYVPVTADIGRAIRFVVTVTLASGGTVAKPSAPTVAIIA